MAYLGYLIKLMVDQRHESPGCQGQISRMGRGFIRLSAAPLQADNEPGLHPEHMHVGDCNVMQLGLPVPALTAAELDAEVTTVHNQVC